MSKILLPYKIYILLAVLIGGYLFLSLLQSEEILPSSLVTHKGTVEEVECESSRSFYGINLKISSNDNYRNTLLNLLPDNINCEALASDIIGKEVSISYLRDIAFGVKVNGAVLINEQVAIQRFNSKGSTLFFVFFCTLVAVLCIYFRSRHITS
jgi:hypothetical protein